MEYISSDTNIWIDFKAIDYISLPFMLTYTYIMFYEALNKELLSPKGFCEELAKYGLQGVDLTEDEFIFADKCGDIYKQLSVYDRIALSIAKHRNIKFMTGDKSLRNAAIKEGVKIIGTIGIVDELYEKKVINKEKCILILKKLIDKNGAQIRLPKKELNDRLQKLLQNE